METKLKHSDVTEKIIAAFYAVYNTLGYGFLEKVYGNAMTLELRRMNIAVIVEAPISVYYADEVIGEYYADLLVAETVLVELKAAKEIAPEHEAQLLNYLKATPYEVGLLLNFGPRAQQKRLAYDNQRKGTLKWLISK